VVDSPALQPFLHLRDRLRSRRPTGKRLHRQTRRRTPPRAYPGRQHGRIHQVFCSVGRAVHGRRQPGQRVTFDPGSAGSGPILSTRPTGFTPSPAELQPSVGATVRPDRYVNPNAPNSSTYDGIDNLGFNGVSCPSEASAPRSTGTATPSRSIRARPARRGVRRSTGRLPASVACPSTSQCTAVDGNGAEYTFHPNGGAIGSLALANTNLTSVSCPSPPASAPRLTWTARKVDVHPATSAQIGSTTTIDPGNALTRLPARALVSARRRRCRQPGDVRSDDESGRRDAEPDPTAQTSSRTSPACHGAVRRVDANGNAIEDDAGTWTVDPALRGGRADEYPVVHTTTGTQCVAADVTGYMSAARSPRRRRRVSGEPRRADDPAGDLQLGDTLTEAHATWSNSSDELHLPVGALQQRRQRCVAIAGATGTRATRSAQPMFGSTIRVAETAINGRRRRSPVELDCHSVDSSGAGAVTTSLPAPPIAKAAEGADHSKHHSAKFHSRLAARPATSAPRSQADAQGAKTPAPKYAACGTTKKYSSSRPQVHVLRASDRPGAAT